VLFAQLVLWSKNNSSRWSWWSCTIGIFNITISYGYLFLHPSLAVPTGAYQVYILYLNTYIFYIDTVYCEARAFIKKTALVKPGTVT
jgi:hypothetical protein